MPQVENLKFKNISYEINDKKALHQWNTMPTASADYLGVVVQYVGADTTDYKNSKLYKCTNDVISIPYIDELFDAQKMTVNSIDANVFKQAIAENLPNAKATAGLYTIMWQNEWELDLPDGTVTTITSPEDYGFDVTVSSYVQGGTFVTFTYKPDGERYTISNIQVSGGNIQSASVGSEEFSLIMFVGYLYKGRKNYNYDLSNGSYTLYNQNNKWYLQKGSEVGLVNTTNHIPGLETVPSNCEDGSTITFDIVTNYNYSYSWNILDLTEVYNGLDSISETKALSAYMGNVLAERIDNIGTIGRFLAMWDADTGIARYLDVGFVYERGDYFIIASTSPRPTLSAFYFGSQTIKGTYPENWKEYFPDVTINTTLTYDSSNDTWYNPDRTVILDGQEILELVRIDGFTVPDEGDYVLFNYVHGQNYMPSGEEYDGPSTTLATDDVRLSDMYYYDGEHWVYMANHEKQIAVDAYLDKASLNPVENRVLANKIEEIEANINTKQDTLISGTNIKTVNNQSLLGTGNIEIKGGGSGGAGYPCIVDVNSKQLSPYSSKQFGDDYNGQYTYMQFTTNLEKEQLVEKMNDLYVTISRRKRQTQRRSGSGKIAKMVVQNDHRFKLNKRLYCWRYTEDDAEEVNPKSYYYYYTEERYNDSVEELFEEDPSIYMYTGYNFPSSKATCLNILDQDTYDWHISDAGDDEHISRYEAGDIDTFVPNKKISKGFDYKDYVTKMYCKEATKDGARYFLWCDDWSDTGNNVYGTGIAEDIPEHFDAVETVTVSEYELGKNRPELAYYVLKSTVPMYDFVESLYYSTMGTYSYPLEDGHYNWNCYPFDYPIIPTRLADCEVLVSMPNADDGTSDRKGEWIKLKEIKDMPFFADLKQVVFRYPLNTAELWMRFSSWQKRCMYQSLNDDLGFAADVKNCWRYAVDGEVNGDTNYAFKKRSFARQRSHFRNTDTHSKVTEYIEFNLATGDDIAHGLMSKSTPVRKRLVSTSHKARSWLSD